MHNILEITFLSKDLFLSMLSPVCEKYGITHTEMIILLFLYTNPMKDTATDVVKSHRLAKSAVSAAVRSLEERGLVTGSFTHGNHRTIHLSISENAASIIEEGMQAQKEFVSVLFEGFSEEEKNALKNHYKKVSLNIKNHFENKT